ncbi:inositol 2-dehydrogenase [Arthrobacter sp. TS-15]|uniref:Gfo/Idh/MocA family oxidoreductase n=1 Tax=Micrococcaceae TaxID=1268 RepID=UPI00115CB36E|nr:MULTISPECIES: Gfo/Idh/MocA family oxidoreductase [Micrococcaceae]MCM0615083.1 Gfo/Idh/MocA family oxidoreductase [Paenarthrobacter sp. TYUT067]TQS91313.1 inositol 2-dehydrogenase [Arthrobacter sp. TS-15]BCW63066.1 inositol 2-dehydrogenase [Arthrobacter sp. StoSoilB22]
MPIRVGVIGAGIMGADHIRNLSTSIGGAEVTFVADLDAGRAAAAAPPLARITTDPTELINSSDVDAVVVASHDSTHAGLILECFEAMTPVLCEKPLAPTLLESLEVVAADADIVAATGASLLSLGFMRRFDPGYVALRRAVQGRAQGEPLMVHCVSRNAAAGPGTTAESAITNSAIHELDIVPWLLDSPVTEVSWQAGKSTRRAEAGLQDPSFMILRTADGTLTTLELYLNAQYGYTTRCEVVSELGTTSLQESSLLGIEQDGVRQASIPADWRPRFADAYRIQLQAWVSALAGGEAPPLAGAQDGLNAALVAQAMIQSLHSDGSSTKVSYS